MLYINYCFNLSTYLFDSAPILEYYVHKYILQRGKSLTNIQLFNRLLYTQLIWFGPIELTNQSHSTRL